MTRPSFLCKMFVKKLTYILNNQSKYENIIKEQEKRIIETDMINTTTPTMYFKRFKRASLSHKLRNTSHGCSKIIYKTGSYFIGRWHRDKGKGLLRGDNTFCNDFWIGADQVYSRPTMLKIWVDTIFNHLYWTNAWWKEKHS